MISTGTTMSAWSPASFPFFLKVICDCEYVIVNKGWWISHPASTCTRSSTRWWSSPGSPRSRGSSSTSECSTGSLSVAGMLSPSGCYHLMLSPAQDQHALLHSLARTSPVQYSTSQSCILASDILPLKRLNIHIIGNITYINPVSPCLHVYHRHRGVVDHLVAAASR